MDRQRDAEAVLASTDLGDEAISARALTRLAEVAVACSLDPADRIIRILASRDGAG